MALKSSAAVAKAMLGDQPEDIPPRVELDSEDLPDIKDWEVGKTYDVTMKIKMTSKSEGSQYHGMDEDDSPGTIHSTFDVISVSDTDAEDATDGGADDATEQD